MYSSANQNTIFLLVFNEDSKYHNKSNSFLFKSEGGLYLGGGGLIIEFII